jgi:hypothetical protein
MRFWPFPAAMFVGVALPAAAQMTSATCLSCHRDAPSTKDVNGDVLRPRRSGCAGSEAA